MSGNAQKTPIGKALFEFAAGRNADALHVVGKRLPCSVTKVEGAIVTVKFEIVSKFNLPKIRVPIANSIYVREPTQVGDKGYVQAADARLGGVDGLGTGTADLALPANLGALVFVPLGNLDWDAAPDPDKLLLQGPKGFYIRDLPGDDPETLSIVGDKDAKTLTFKVKDVVSIVLDEHNVVITGDTQVQIVVGSITVTVDSSGITVDGDATFDNDLEVSGDLVVSGDLTVDGNTSLGGGALPVKLSDGSNSTTVKAT